MSSNKTFSAWPEQACQLVELSGDIICVASAEGYFTALNGQWGKLLDYSDDELTSQPLINFVHPDDQASTLSVLQALQGSSAITGFENRFLDKSGKAHWLLWSARFDPKERCYFAIAKDITQCKKEEQRVLENNLLINMIQRVQSRFITDVDPREVFSELLESLLELTQSKYGFIGEVRHNPDGVPYLKTHAITNIAWNQATRDFYEQNAPQGLEFFNLNSLFGEVIRSGEPMLANDPGNHPKRCGIPEGHPALNAFLGLPFFHGEEMIGMVGLANREGGYDQALIDFLQPLLASCASMIMSLRNDMQRRNALSQKESSDKMVGLILDSAVDGIVTIDEMGIMKSFNPAAERIFGYALDEVIDKNIKMLMPSPYSDLHDNYLKHYRDTGERKIIGIGREVLGLRKDGSTFPLDLAVSELDMDGVRMFTGIVRDITERKMMERMKNEFVSTVSHELRTPLTSIRGSLGVIQGGVVGELTEKGSQLVNIAVNNCDRLVRLINDILDIEKMESGMMEFNFSKVDITSLIERVLESNRAFAEQHDASLEFDVQSTNVWAKCDSDRFDQVLTNLLSNAIKYSPEGGAVTLSLNFDEERMIIEVIDQGAGVPESFRARLFEKFAMADGSDTRLTKGTGLGLSISQAIVERHGGAISYVDRDGIGSCFQIRMPAWQPMAES